jgi:hypothetical protein
VPRSPIGYWSVTPNQAEGVAGGVGSNFGDRKRK